MVYTDVTMLLSEKLLRVVVLQDVTLCRLEDRNQCFGETCFHNLQGRRLSYFEDSLVNVLSKGLKPAIYESFMSGLHFSHSQNENILTFLHVSYMNGKVLNVCECMRECMRECVCAYCTAY